MGLVVRTGSAPTAVRSPQLELELELELAATGSRVVAPVTTSYGMREFAVVDPNGNLVRVGSATESEGLSP